MKKINQKVIQATPRGIIAEVKHKNGTFGVKLIWNQPQLQKRSGSFITAQQFVDSKILRLSDPYTPMLTGLLIKSSQLHTVIGSGLVVWRTPYARRQYYLKSGIGRETGPLRGPYWFHRMKADKGKRIIAGAKKIAGRG